MEPDARVLGSKVKREDWTFEQDMVFEHAMAEFDETVSGHIFCLFFHFFKQKYSLFRLFLSEVDTCFSLLFLAFMRFVFVESGTGRAIVTHFFFAIA